MKKILLATALLAVLCSANAQGLLGTSASVFESSFCKKWTCVFNGKSTSGGLEAYSYGISPYPDGWTPETMKTFRRDGKIVSALFTYPVQDQAFYPNSETGKKFADFVNLFSGARLSASNVNSGKYGECFNMDFGKSYLTCKAESFRSSNGYGGATIIEHWIKLK